jgi:putative ABC transport system ATP-binding protein
MSTQRGIDLGVGRRTVAIVGPLDRERARLNLLGAIETPTTGHVLEGVDGDVNDTERTLFAAVGSGLFFHIQFVANATAIENVALPLNSMDKRVGRASGRTRIELVDLDRHDHVPSMMSGGEQQRVAVARKWVIQPAIVWPTNRQAIWIA